MAKYHIIPESGEPGVCRARTRPCPYGAESPHFRNVKEAREFQEEFERLTHLADPAYHRPHPLTEIALKSDLSYSGEEPGWFAASRVRYGLTWGEEEQPELIDRIPFGDRELAVIWEDRSSAEIDINIIKERGMACSRLILVDWETGDEVGSVKAGYVDEDSYRYSFGDDEYSAMRYYKDHSGHGQMGSTYDYETKIHTDHLELVKDPEKRLEARKAIWASCHAALDWCPEGFDRSTIGSWSMVGLKASHAPDDEKILDRDIAKLQEFFEEEKDNFIASHSSPSIDYSEVRDEHRGKGIGPSMYVYAARKMAEKNLPQRASGLQSDEAAKLWRRMASDPSLPISVTNVSWSLKEYNQTYWKNAPRLSLDFRTG